MADVSKQYGLTGSFGPKIARWTPVPGIELIMNDAFASLRRRGFRARAAPVSGHFIERVLRESTSGSDLRRGGGLKGVPVRGFGPAPAPAHGQRHERMSLHP